MLGFGTDGGLLVTGSPDPGLGGVTIAGLPATNVLGSSYGAGYAIWPDGYLRSYEVANGHEQLSIIHVPVRRSKEFMLFAVHNRDLGFYTNDGFDPESGPVGFRPTDAVDVPWAHEMLVRPSGLVHYGVVAFPDYPYNTLYGYFGWAMPIQQGVLHLEDVFRVTARRKCLYLECKDTGGGADTPSPAFTLFRMALLVEKWGLQKSTIISAQLRTGDTDIPGLKQGLQYCKSKGIEIAVHITSTDEATANPPQSLISLGCTWVAISFGVPAATVDTYIDAGLQVMMFTADRQWHWTTTQQIGARGAFCSDPIYASGHTFGFRYRLVNPPAPYPHIFSGQAPDYGRTGYSGTLTGMHARNRGWVDRPDTAMGIVKAGPQMTPPTNSGFHMPMGPWCPIYDRNLPDPPPQGNYGTPTNYDLSFTAQIVGANWQPGGQQGMGFFFCVPRDVRLFDLTAAAADTIGYSFLVASNGNFVFRRYSGGSGNWAYSFEWPSGWTAAQFTDGAEFPLGVQVRPGSIRCGPANDMTGPNSRQFTATTPAGAGADMHRGPYFYLSFWEAAGFPGFRHFKFPTVVNFA